MITSAQPLVRHNGFWAIIANYICNRDSQLWLSSQQNAQDPRKAIHLAATATENSRPCKLQTMDILDFSCTVRCSSVPPNSTYNKTRGSLRCQLRNYREQCWIGKCKVEKATETVASSCLRRSLTGVHPGASCSSVLPLFTFCFQFFGFIPVCNICSHRKLYDSDYTDDVVLLNDDPGKLRFFLYQLNYNVGLFGIRVKCCCLTGLAPKSNLVLKEQPNEVNSFSYLGS